MRTLASSLPLDDPLAATCMPESWIRASMSIRLNSLSTGVSGVQVATTDCLAELLNHDIVPRIPIRGSISASGDLSPLSFIGGVMQGKPTLTTWTGDRSAGQRRIARADIALKEAGIRSVKLGPKEGLAIVNGTAISAGVAALAMHEAHPGHPFANPYCHECGSVGGNKRKLPSLFREVSSPSRPRRVRIEYLWLSGQIKAHLSE